MIKNRIEQFCPSNSAPDLNDLIEWGTSSTFTLPVGSESRVRLSFERLMEHVNGREEKIYGLHTGFGSDVSAKASTDWKEHQFALLRYLQVGVGKSLPASVVRRAIRLQTFKSSLGFSGIHPETFARLWALCHTDKLPEVPCYGSLGASGDLVSMAHAVEPLFTNKDDVRGPRDVLTLVNTNAMMASYGIELFSLANKILFDAIHLVAMSSYTAGYGARHFTESGIDLPYQCPQVSYVANKMVEFISEFENTQENRPVPGAGEEQARYSLRCSPNVLGGALWSFKLAGERIQLEALRVADNPVVLEKEIWHGGHFYALGIAQAADLLSDGVFRICEMLDRQVLILMSPDLNNGLARNLEVAGESHLKGIHQLMSSLLQQLKTHQMPSRMLSFSCEGNNQDIVPCGMAALNSLSQQMDIALEMIRAASFVFERGFSLRRAEQISPELYLKSWSSYAP